jgi:pilus assembly protein Flp/PilA
MKVNVLATLRNLHNDESGQDLVEYALVAALIALAAIGGMQGLASKINSSFSVIGSHLAANIS